jgi:hypothetical protein
VIPPSSPVAAAGQIREPEHLDTPFPPTLVEELLRLVAKTARAHQLYLPNNPIYRGAIDSFRGGFAAIWKETNEITLTIAEGEFQWCDVAVWRDAAGTAKTTDSLPWLFYKDGLRELTFAKGFEEQEALTFLEMIQRARKATADEDDLVTMLWEADFTFLKYAYVDLLHDGSAGALADGSDVTTVTTEEIRRTTHDIVEPAKTRGIVDMADFDATLYFLDDREIEYLQSEIVREYQQDLRVNISEVLLDIFEAQAKPEVRDEVLDDLQTLMVYLLAAGHFRGAAQLLREASKATQRAMDVTSEQLQRLSHLPDRLSTPDVLSQLIQSLDGSANLPARGELEELFDQLRPAAMATVFQWLGKLQNDDVRAVVTAVAERLASTNTTELIRLIHAEDRDVSSEAIRRAGSAKAQAAVAALGRVLADPDPARRLLSVQALTEIGSPGALQALERALEDGDRDVRIHAARTVMARSHRPALARLDTVVKGKAVRAADLTEKMVIFEAYGSMCGDSGVALLDALLNGKGLLRHREDSEMRACAAIALGRVGTEMAVAALRKAAVERDVIVRNAVARALRGEARGGDGAGNSE